MKRVMRLYWGCAVLLAAGLQMVPRATGQPPAVEVRANKAEAEATEIPREEEANEVAVVVAEEQQVEEAPAAEKVLDVAEADEFGFLEVEVVEGGMAGGVQAHDPRIALLMRYVRTERGLVRRACELSESQLEELEKLNAAWLRNQIAQPELPGKERVLEGIGRFLGGRVAQPRPQDDGAVVRRVHGAIDEHIANALDDHQRALFQAERQARETFRREALAETLVAALDEHIHVTAQQRGEFVKQVSQWLGDQNFYWQFYFQNDSYIPGIPRSVLVKCLSEEQVNAMAGMNAYNYSLDDFQQHLNGMQEVIVFDDE